jgi:hypothetical protein
MEYSSSFLPALLQKRQVISVLSVVIILLMLGVSVSFTHLYQAHAANSVNWSIDNMIGEKSKQSPAMATFNNQLYVAYVSVVSNEVYIVSSGDGTNWSDGIFTKQYTSGSSGSSIALAVYNSKLYMVFVANDGANTLLIASSRDGTTWSNGVPISNYHLDKTAIALTVYNNKLYMAFISASGNVHIDSYDGTKWSGESQVGSPTVAPYSTKAPSLAAFNNQLYVAYSANDGNVLISAYNGTSWSNEIHTGQVSQAAPALTVFQNELFVAFADNGNNDHLLYLSSDGTYWPDSLRILGQYTHDTPAIAVLNNRVYIAYLANNTSHDLLIVSGSGSSSSSSSSS